MVLKKRSHTVAVTGFGPYREFTHNTSAQIRDALPSQIPHQNAPPITILKYPHDIPCIYTDILDLVPELWSGNRSVYDPDAATDKKVWVDLMLHVGMHPDEGFHVERRVRNGEYVHAGVDGRFLGREALKGGPATLSVEIDVEGVVARVREKMPDDIEIRASNDAGLYFCEFITYASLALLDRRREFGRVVFLHVPKDRSEESVMRGVQVAVALILECVDALPSEYSKGG